MSKQRKLTMEQEKLRILLKETIRHHPQLAEAFQYEGSTMIIDEAYFSTVSSDGDPRWERSKGWNKV